MKNLGICRRVPWESAQTYDLGQVCISRIKHDKKHILVLHAPTNRQPLHVLIDLPCDTSGRDGRVLFGPFRYELGAVAWEEQGEEGDLE